MTENFVILYGNFEYLFVEREGKAVAKLWEIHFL